MKTSRTPAACNTPPWGISQCVCIDTVLWAGVSGELPLTTPMGRCRLYATANTLYHSCPGDIAQLASLKQLNIYLAVQLQPSPAASLRQERLVINTIISHSAVLVRKVSHGHCTPAVRAMHQ
jgi:hypothetical protein